MEMFGTGEITFLVASTYFAVFIALHVLVVVIARRFASTPPREADRRARAAGQIGALQAAKAGWFAVLFTVAATTVVEATPKLPLLEVITVYGGMIGVVASLAQAVEWSRVRARVRASHRALQAMTVLGDQVDELVTIQLPRTILDRLRDGGVLQPDELATIRLQEQQGAQ